MPSSEMNVAGNMSNITNMTNRTNTTAANATAVKAVAATLTGMDLIKTIPSTFQLYFTLVIIVLVLILLAFDKGPPHHVMLMAVVILWNVDLFNYKGKAILTVNEALAGFSNTSMITVGALFVTIAAVDKCRIVNFLANRALGQSGQLWASAKLQVLAFVLSAFTNNIPMQALLTPIVCDWCRSRQFPSSKFLLSLDYANIGGGMLATIGTSTNLVVNGLLTSAGVKQFSFFEPAYVALPLGVLSILWMLLMHRFLPNNSEVFLKSVRDRSDEMVTAFELNPESSLVGHKVSEVITLCGVQRQELLKIVRQRIAPEVLRVSTDESRTPIRQKPSKKINWSSLKTFFTGKEKPEQYMLVSTSAAELGFDHFASHGPELIDLSEPSPDELAEGGDTFFFTMRRETIIDVVNYSSHTLLVSNEFAVKQFFGKSVYKYVILGPKSPLVGSPVRTGAKLLDGLYNVGLIAYQEDDSVLSKEKQTGDIEHLPGERHFVAGDRLLLLAPEKTEFPKGHFVNVDSLSEKKKTSWFYDFFPLLMFIGGITWASFDENAMVRVAVFMFCGMVLGGWIKTDDVVNIMNWDILILIGSSIALGTALSNSGIASALAVLVRAAGLGPQGALFLLTTVVILLNEIVTNNAAATLGIPLAIALTKELKLPSYRSYAMAVLLGGSAAYACPIGYATHMMVIAPGNYTFKDFLKFGTMLDIIYIVGITVILPWIYPLE